MPEDRCSCGNAFDGDNFCMPSACQWEGIPQTSPLGVGEVRDSDGTAVAHALAQESAKPDVDYTLSVVWRE